MAKYSQRTQRREIIGPYLSEDLCMLGDGFEGAFKGENELQSPAHLLGPEEQAHPLAPSRFTLIEGAPLSYNNWTDLGRALQTATHIAAGFQKLTGGAIPPMALGLKHGNASGAACSYNGRTDWDVNLIREMINGDPLAIFGGFVLTNFKITEEAARTMISHQTGPKRVYDVVVAPAFDPAAVGVLKRASGGCRMLINPALETDLANLDAEQRSRYLFAGEVLIQPNYTFVLDWASPDLLILGHPLGDRLKFDLTLAWAVGCTSNSNTIALASNGRLLANAVGQQSRIAAAELAIGKALKGNDGLHGAVAYSDSFFPFPDAPLALLEAGVKAIFATSGSVRDEKNFRSLNLSERGASLVLLPDSLARGFYGH